MESVQAFTVEQRLSLLAAENLKKTLICGIMELTQEERETLLEMWKRQVKDR